jgi:hypothetical protein
MTDDNSTTMHGAELIADTSEQDHDASIDSLWLTMGEIKEIYTEVQEQQTPRREAYQLDELATIDFHRNYDGTYTLADNGTTLTTDEWKDVCEWFFEQHDDEKYVNDLHEYLEEHEAIVDYNLFETGGWTTADGAWFSFGWDVPDFSNTDKKIIVANLPFTVTNIDYDATHGSDVYVAAEPDDDSLVTDILDAE